MKSAPSSAGHRPAAPQWPEVLGSEEGGWGGAALELSPGWTGIFIAPVFLDLPPPGFMRSVAVAGIGNEGGGGGANTLLQGLILGLGTLAVMKVTKSKQGVISGNTEAERLFRAASAMQAVVRPGETRGFPTAPSVTFTAIWGVGEAGVGGGESGSHPSSRPGLWLCISSLLIQRV